LTREVDVAVLGGGVAGLAAAIRLRTMVPAASIALIEAEATPGGKLCGEVRDGCIIDGGPDLCIESKLARATTFHALGIGSELIPVNPAGLPTFRRSRGALTPMPGVVTDGLVTMRSGMHDIVRLMMSALIGARLHLGTEVNSVRRGSDGWIVESSDGMTIRAAAIVCALPAAPAAGLFTGVIPQFAEAASRVHYLPLTTVSAAWRADAVPKALAGTGFIEMDPADGELTACTWTSSKIPTRSPSDVVLLRGYVRTADSAHATQVAVGEMSGFLDATAEPLWTRAHSWAHALPQYPPHHDVAVSNLRSSLEPVTDFAFAGAAWDGVGIGDCMCSGENAAERIAAILTPG
jgi:protoporphyrinogen oxidase